ncbi:MAG: bifunctional alpha,alpha-trehalose-phosphate synthase (UDP-forming)/trehalose-phosphatase [Chitinophagaceae bacterium]|nr:bifunctional alpha,alpha-trehalose-phosphate synthase (UDP-forming)/trehalose-phosphatase [Chitinophagaceae bacterium]
MSRLIIISNRLPFSVERSGEEISLRQSSGGLISSLKSYFEKNTTDKFTERIWIGSCDLNTAEWKRTSDSIQGKDFTIEPVFIKKEIYENYYNGFANSTLWPLFHYFPSLVVYNKDFFNAYMESNRLFAEKTLEIMRPGDVVWIHDYHLLLVPQLIRNVDPAAVIGFFLHIPFPSYEIFRLLPTLWKRTLLQGILGADLIGFHTYDYVQHFIQSAKMVLEVDNQFNTINYNNRIIKTDLFPIGIDFDKFRNSCSNEKLSVHINDIKQSFAGKKIIFSVDRLDYTKGLTNRLKGYEDFLEQHPEWHEKVSFVFNIVPSRDLIPTYSDRKKMVEEKISTINGRFSTISWQPLMYRYNHLGFEELCTLYRAADIALITPLRDGMNLVAKEYVATNDKRGVLILSELTGAASELNEAILVNPTDSQAVADAIVMALTMPIEEQQSRMRLMQKRLYDYDVVRWVNDFLDQLYQAKNEQKKAIVKWLDTRAVSAIQHDFSLAERRCILLDYDGTLAPYAKVPSEAKPGKEVISMLADLAADERNEVVVISGRDSNTLDKWLGHLNINFVAEHGVFIKYKNQQWETQVALSSNWKDMVRPILELYVTRCSGSLIEEKKNTLTWHYRNTHPGLGFSRSRELLNNLLQMTGNTPIQVIDGNKVIEVRLMGVDKGNTALKIIDYFKSDFVLCLGDDTTDEDMFRIIRNKGYTVKVGPGTTAAEYTLSSQTEVVPLLKKFLDP